MMPSRRRRALVERRLRRPALGDVVVDHGDALILPTGNDHVVMTRVPSSWGRTTSLSSVPPVRISSARR